MCKGIHTYFWLYTAVSGRMDWIRQITTTTPRAPLAATGERCWSKHWVWRQTQCSWWQWSKHSMWHQRLLMITDDDQNIEYDASGVSARGRAWPIEGPPPLQLLQLFTRCAQLYKNSHGFPCPVKPSTKSAPRYFSSAGLVKSTVDPSRDTGEPPAAWTFYMAPHELY